MRIAMPMVAGWSRLLPPSLFFSSSNPTRIKIIQELGTRQLMNLPDTRFAARTSFKLTQTAADTPKVSEVDPSASVSMPSGKVENLLKRSG